MKNNSNKILFFSFLIILIGGIYFFVTKQKSSDSQGKKATDEYDIKLAEYRKTLQAYENGNLDDKYKVYEALIRLGEVKDALALKLAIDFSKEEILLLREGSAQTLAYYPDEKSTEVLMTLLSDKEASVREFAARGLGKSQSKERLELVRKMLTDNKMNFKERLALLTSFRNLAADAESKSWALNQIVNVANDKNSSEITAREEAALLLVQIAPYDEATKKVIQNQVLEGSSEKVLGVGIRLLATNQDPWIIPQLSKLSEHKSPIVRKAVIQSLHRNCPAHRWELMNRIMKSETDKSVIETGLREAALLAGNEAITFLSNINKTKLHEQGQKIYDEVTVQLSANSTSACATSKLPDKVSE